MKCSLYSIECLQLLHKELQATSYSYKTHNENLSYMSNIRSCLKPIQTLNYEDAVPVEQMEKFYMQKMSDFGFAGFEHTVNQELVSQSESALTDMDVPSTSRNSKKKFDNQFLYKKKIAYQRLSALTRRTSPLNQSDLKTDIEVIPDFNEKVKYLKEKDQETSQKIYDVNNGSHRQKKVSHSAKSSSTRFNSASLMICKFVEYFFLLIVKDFIWFKVLLLKSKDNFVIVFRLKM